MGKKNNTKNEIENKEADNNVQTDVKDTSVENAAKENAAKENTAKEDTKATNEKTNENAGSIDEKVAENKSSIDKNRTNIEENRTNIEENRNSIEANREGIEKNRKLIYAMFACMSVLLIVFIVTTCVLGLKYRHMNKIINDRGKGSIETNIIVDEATNGSEAVISEAMTGDSAIADDVLPGKSDEDASDNKEASNDYMIHFIVNGYKFYVPNEFECMAIENVGVIIYEADSFQMKVVAKGRPYEEVIKDEASIKNAVKASGGEITSDILSAKVNDRNYTFFRCKIDKDEQFVIYGDTPDKKSHTGGQIQIFDKNLSDEDLLSIFDSVASTAEVYEDLTVKEDDSDSHVRDYSTIKFDGCEVTYNVPTGLFYSDTIEYENNVIETYWDEVTLVYVDIKNHAQYDSAKDYVLADIGTNDDEDIKKEKIGDLKVYYYIGSEEGSTGSMNQKVYAACDIDDEHIFHVEYTVYESDQELTYDDISEFFEFSK